MDCPAVVQPVAGSSHRYCCLAPADVTEGADASVDVRAFEAAVYSYAPDLHQAWQCAETLARVWTFPTAYQVLQVAVETSARPKFVFPTATSAAQVGQFVVWHVEQRPDAASDNCRWLSESVKQVNIVLIPKI